VSYMVTRDVVLAVGVVNLLAIAAAVGSGWLR
jgi:hypothetical protein